MAAVLLLAAACGSSVPTPTRVASAGASQVITGVLPVFVSSELTVGPNRFLFSFSDAAGKPAASPDRTGKVQFRGPGGESVAADPGKFIWAIQDVSGVYLTHADFPVAGAWTAVFSTAAPGSPEESIPFSFDVLAKASAVQVGAKAPSVKTPTLGDVGGSANRISSDPSPMASFYETSVAEALAAHKPFVLVFATPKFCKSATCGPTLDKVKTVAAAHPGVTFINVEPYKLTLTDGQLQPDLSSTGQLQTVPATDAYGLLSEPYVFVVGGDGIVKASFELIFTPEEIDAALTGLK
jgi:hypothetical protein